MNINKYLISIYFSVYKFYLKYFKKRKWELKLEHFSHNESMGIYTYSERDLDISILYSNLASGSCYLKFHYVSGDIRYQSGSHLKSIQQAISVANQLYFKHCYKALMDAFKKKVF